MSSLRLARVCGLLAVCCAVASATPALDVPIFADAFESGDCSAWTFCQTPPALRLLTEPEPSVDFGERVPLRVSMRTGTGLPLAGTLVDFAPQQDTADTTSSPIRTLTTKDGLAETVVHGGFQPVDFDVRIDVPNDDTVEPITVRVHIQPKDAADYIIRVEYPGLIVLDQVEVTLYENDRTCDSLVESPTADPSDDVAWTSLVILPDLVGSLPERGLIVPPAVTFEYAVARAKAVDGMGGSLDYFATFGCQDTIPLPQEPTAILIEIPMHDLLPPG